MATLTTTRNIQYFFNPSSIVAISDHDPSTGAAVTCIYGISVSGYLPIQESPQAFMTRLNITADFGQLTAAGTGLYWFNLSSAVSVCPPAIGSSPGANSVVLAGTTTYAVQESPQDAAAILKLS
jgi:hypothetical protein